MLQIDVVTLFPPMFEAVTESGVTGRARERKAYELVLWNPRDFAANAYRTVDDRPYGGGPGMVMMVEPLEKALQAAKQRQRGSGVKKPRVLHLTPQGRLLDHSLVDELAKEEGLVMLASRYEGVDERLTDRVIDDEVSIGDYVLSGGEMAAMIVLDACVRLLPGVMGKEASGTEESFESNRLEYPHYTRPREWEGRPIPDVLLSGNHALIERWRREESERITRERRPDLLDE